MNLQQAAALAASVFLVGCVMQHPQTAEEFRQARTRLQIFMPSMGHDLLLRAIKGWASGQNLGCPDLTKI